MEETERPRKVQKLDHFMENFVEDEDTSTAAGDRSLSKSAEEAIQSQPCPKETANDHGDDEDEIVDTGVTDTTGKENGNSAAPTLSKNQLKKKLRDEKWEAGKEFRKAKKKQKRKEKKEKLRAAKKQSFQNSSGAGENGASKESTVRGVETIKSRTLLPLAFIIDCGYDELMHDKERKSLSSQVTRSYSDNIKSPYRAHLMVSSFNGLLKERFDGTLRKDYENWKGVTLTQDGYMAAAELAKSQMSGPNGGEMAGPFTGKASTNAEEEGEIVYLTSDSPDTLTELKPYSTYIIGGIVDKNRHKGICYKSAMDNGIKTAKLPIGDYMKMNSRFVLATNHVVEIMLKWLELGDWGESFMQVMPKRKGGELKGKDGEATPDQEALEQEAQEQEDQQQEDQEQEDQGQEDQGQEDQEPEDRGQEESADREQDDTKGIDTDNN